MPRHKSLAAAIVIAAAGLAGAQHHAMPGPEKPVALLAGLGTWKHTIATSNAEAQKFFDQGLTLLYSFNRYEALRSFRKASELDPQAAMPHWGMAMALGPHINMDMEGDVKMKDSCAAAEGGLQLKSIAAPERAWLEAAAARCPDFAEPARYIRAMHDLAAKQPDDPDAQALYAESIMVPVRWHWYAGGKPAEGMEEAERVLERLLRRYPDHPGANHFYIHAVESSPTPERAVPSAQRLMGIVPAAGHMVHMPGHIWLVLGDYENAVAVNERAAEVDRQYFARTGVMSSYGPYYLHNLSFVLYARSMQGRSADVKKAADEMSGALAMMAGPMPEMSDIFGMFITMAQVRVGRWDDVLAAKQPKAVPVAVPLWRYARTMAYLGKNDTAAAKREWDEFESARKAADPNFPWDTNKAGDVFNVAAAVLAARMEPSPAKAVALWKNAVEAQDVLVYDEPPGWYYPVRESLGAALLLSGDAAAAESVFREALAQSPRNGRVLFGLMESLKTQGKKEAAEWIKREFDAAWKGADVELRVKSL